MPQNLSIPTIRPNKIYRKKSKPSLQWRPLSDRVISKDELYRLQKPLNAPIDNQLFLPSKKASNAISEFSGRLTIGEHSMNTKPSKICPSFLNGRYTQIFPKIKMDLISDKGHLIPIVRDIINDPGTKSYWRFQASPGKVWSESTDGREMSRASFPFILTGIDNESYHGVALFLYKENGEVSQLRYQIIHSTAPYFLEQPFEAFGQVDVGYEPQTFDHTSNIKKAFHEELAARLPRHSWSELEQRYGHHITSLFHKGDHSKEILASGLIIDGAIYTNITDTPYGAFPYPEEMRIGVWSATKSAAGLVAMLYLAQKYGPQIFTQKIKDFIYIKAPHHGWDSVTFADALNMATGIGDGSHRTRPNSITDGYMNSNQKAFDDWYLAPSNQEKLDHIFKIPPYPWGPGKHVRYQDRDFYILAAALSNFVKSREGSEANLWSMMEKEVYKPIGIHHLDADKSIEPNGKLGVPFLAWGLYLTIDDLAKISILLQNGGKYKDQQILHSMKLKEALYQTTARGLPTGNRNQFGKETYHMSLWHSPYRTKGGRMVSIPKMIGWGGNVIGLMPNGLIGFKLGRSGNVPLEGMIPVSEMIRSFDQDPVYRYRLKKTMQTESLPHPKRIRC